MGSCHDYMHFSVSSELLTEQDNFLCIQINMVTPSLFELHLKLQIVIDVPVCNRIVELSLTHR